MSSLCLDSSILEVFNVVMRKTYILISILAVVIVAVAVWMNLGSKSIQPIACTTEAKLCPDGSSVGRTGPKCEFAVCPNGLQYTNSSADLINIKSPLPNDFVKKEFSITGEARGNWFFEASFPIVVLGKDGEVLAQTHATAGGDWMTENFVPFTADIKIPASYVGPAKIILKNDNPSGLPERDASVSFDVIISANEPIVRAISGDVVLGVGQKGKVGDLSVTVNSLVGDSRCPVDVQCIWAGALKVNVMLADVLKSETRDMSSGEVPYLFDGHNISITSVIPAPKSATKIAVDEYRITFHITVNTKKDFVSTGTIKGLITLSPICPVERMPPEPQCAPKPYQTKVEIFSADNSKLIKSTQTGSDGIFAVTLPFGNYNIQAGGGTIYPRCSPVVVSLKTATTSVDISCDTGIR